MLFALETRRFGALSLHMDPFLTLSCRFIYIPQHGPGTASLNVAVAAALVLHHYALWAGYGERERSGYKYVVAERPAHREGKRGVVPLVSLEGVPSLLTTVGASDDCRALCRLSPSP